jgi:hypothetical protein
MAHVCHVVPPLLPQNMISRSVRHGTGNMCVRVYGLKLATPIR